jgi:hypothetical protein
MSTNVCTIRRGFDAAQGAGDPLGGRIAEGQRTGLQPAENGYGKLTYRQAVEAEACGGGRIGGRMFAIGLSSDCRCPSSADRG